jgi:cytochrome c oxidase subunit 2
VIAMQSGWNVPLFPERASTHAAHVDAVYLFLVVLCTAMAVVISLMITVFAIKYRASKKRPAQQIHGNNVLEITWTVVPLCIFMLIFVWGASVYYEGSRPPKNSEEIWVVAKQWMWKVQHLDGQREINELHVPVGRDIQLNMISQDVIHSFFVPEFRIKADVLPQRYTHIWFHATKSGEYHLFCAEYCGTLHSGMIGRVVVMEPAQYQAWLSGGGAFGSLAQNGEKLFQDLGCVTCHRSDAQARGPNLVGAYGNPVSLSDGRTVTMDDAYIRESILDPKAKVVAGFQPIMPSFRGQVDEEGVLALIAYIRSLGQQQLSEPVTNRPVPANAPPTGTKVK